jgi:HlyD family secretion protein
MAEKFLDRWIRPSLERVLGGDRESLDLPRREDLERLRSFVEEALEREREREKARALEAAGDRERLEKVLDLERRIAGDSAGLRSLVEETRRDRESALADLEGRLERAEQGSARSLDDVRRGLVRLEELLKSRAAAGDQREELESALKGIESRLNELERDPTPAPLPVAAEPPPRPAAAPPSKPPSPGGKVRAARKRRTRRILIAIAIFILAAGGIAYSFFPKTEVKTVTVAAVEQVPELRAIVNGSGEIQTEDSVDIQAEIAGVIIELPVREGDAVKKGQVLLKIDPFQTQTDVQAARSGLSAAEAEAAGQAFQVASSEANIARDQFLKKSAEVEKRQAEANLVRARQDLERQRKLLAENLIAPEQFEITETQFKVNEAQVEAATARIEQLDAQIKATRANLDYVRSSRDALLQRVEGARSSFDRAEDLFKKTTIRSPLDGVVVKLNVEVGERAVPGILSNPQATLMTIADLSIIEAELKIDETDIVNVELGQTGKVEVDALPDTPLEGRVIEIGNSPILSTSSTGQEGKDFKVVLRIDHPPASLRPGMSCDADITTKVLRDALVVPIQALTVRDVQIDAEGKYVPPPPPSEKVAPGSVAAADSAREKRKELQGVFLVGDGGRARFRPVKTGTAGEMDMEILDGLALGEEVIVGPLKALRTLEEHHLVAVDRSKPFKRFARKKGTAAAAEDEEEQ